MAILSTLLYILFCLSAFVLIVVILLQEGSGGFGQALGEQGQQTFGVGAKGINTFTGVTAGVFIASALVLHMLNRSLISESAVDAVPTVESTLPAGIQDVGAGALPITPTDE
ncbi:MAG TPA: preprotein translocase subunit SecG [Planctomycetes bacterium]|nr:preprotein translocase subunit SecG [Planctomycetota bacterium]